MHVLGIDRSKSQTKSCKHIPASQDTYTLPTILPKGDTLTIHPAMKRNSSHCRRSRCRFAASLHSS